MSPKATFPPTVCMACPLSQNLVVPERQFSVKEFVLYQHLQGMLACMHELLQFAQPLQVAPFSSGSLLCPPTSRFDEKEVAKHVLASLRDEWDMVLALEAEEPTAALLGRYCPQTKTQCYREIQSWLEAEDWALTSRSRALILAWIPSISSSRST